MVFSAVHYRVPHIFGGILDDFLFHQPECEDHENDGGTECGNEYPAVDAALYCPGFPGAGGI